MTRKAWLAALLLVAVAVACDAPLVERAVVAPQEPVALLTLPENAEAGVVVGFDATASLDVDGALVAATLDFGDGAAPEVRNGDASTWRFEHRYASAGRFVVQLEVQDDQGLVGRARLPLVVAPPPDQGAPTLDELTLGLGGQQLEEDARVPAGASLEVTARATDAEGHLQDVELEAATAQASLAVGPDGRAAGTLTLTDVGEISVRAVAVDAFGNRSAPATVALRVVAPDVDSDGDGLPDLDDPAPDVENGLRAELFLLAELFDDGIPTDLLGNQRAERVVDAVAEATPVQSRVVTAGFLASATEGDALAVLFPDAPDVAGGFAVRFIGFLDPPAGADAVRVEVGADDIGVVQLGGNPVASADEEYARDFLRFDRVPAESEDLAASHHLPVEILVANGEGPVAWQVRFRFLAQGVSVMVPEAVGPRQFTAR